MARLRVGDIEIDGSNVSIGGVPQIPAAPTSAAATPAAAKPAPGTALVVQPRAMVPASSPRATEGLDALATFPVGHRVLLGAGGGLGVAAAVLLVATQAVAAVPLIFTGIGGIVLGLLKRRAVGRRAVARARAEEQALAEYAARLRPLLSETRPEQTVEWIVERSGLPEVAVVRTLALMRDRHEIVEELNTDTGEWYYGPGLALPAASRALDDRLAELEQGDRKP